MSIHRLNHAVLYVRDTARSVAFYRDVLGFEVVSEIGNGAAAFLRAAGSTNDHDLGLFRMGPGATDSPAGRTSVGLYHLAWEVDTLRDLERIAAALAEAGALVGASDHSTTKSLYRLDADVLAGRTEIRPLDLTRELERYGADTPGGIGVSRVAPMRS